MHDMHRRYALACFALLSAPWSLGANRLPRHLARGLKYVCCMHTLYGMDSDRNANLLGALSLALADRMVEEAEARAQHGAAAPAALVTVGVEPGITVGGLAKVLGLTHSATVRLVDRLATDALIKRDRCEDRRSVSLYLTARGTSRRRAILEARSRILRDALATLSSEDQSQLSGHLETLLFALTGSRLEANHTCRLCDEEVCPEARCPVENAARLGSK